MGLLDKAIALKENKDIDQKAIKEHHVEVIKREEDSNTVEPKIAHDLQTGKVFAIRPKGALKSAKSKPKFVIQHI